jgi:rhodanese-related sulfurtransferase
MGMCNLKIAPVKSLIRIMIVLLGSLVLAIIINAFHPMRLPLRLAGVKRPGIPKHIWNELRFTNARDAYNKVLAENRILIDVRDRDDFHKAHAIGAINLPYHGFEEYFPAFAKKVSNEEPLFIYCYGTQCGLSARVAKRLLVLGFKDLTIIRHGFEAWKKSNLPIDKMTQGGSNYEAKE